MKQLSRLTSLILALSFCHSALAQITAKSDSTSKQEVDAPDSSKVDKCPCSPPTTAPKCDPCDTNSICASQTVSGDGSYANPAVVELNFHRRQFTHIPDDLKRGDYYRLHICRINPALYKINIGAADTSSNKALPPPSFGSLGLTELTTLAASVSALGGILGPAGRSNAKMTKIEESFQSDGLVLFKKMIIESALEQADGASNKKRAAIDTTVAGQIVDTYVVTLSQHANELSAIKDSVEFITLTVDNYALQAKLQQSTEARPTTTSLLDLNSRLRSVRNHAFGLANEAKQAAINYTILIAPFQKTVAGNPSLKARNEKALAAAQELDKGVEAAKATMSAENTRTLFSGLVNIVNSSEHSYLSLPIQLTKDQSQLKISIIPRADELLLQPFSTRLLLPLETKDFWGVSTGFYLSGLHNDAYSTRTLLDSPLDSTAEYQIVKERPGRAEFGVSAMLRFSHQFESIAIHGGFGPALSISDKVRPRVMVGGGLGFGSRHKFLLDAGFIGGYVDRKSQVFNTDRVLTKPDKITVSKLDVQGYFGIHYLFLQY